jgi:hypothetical protein
MKIEQVLKIYNDDHPQIGFRYIRDFIARNNNYILYNIEDLEEDNKDSKTWKFTFDQKSEEKDDYSAKPRISDYIIDKSNPNYYLEDMTLMFQDIYLDYVLFDIENIMHDNISSWKLKYYSFSNS